MFGFLFKLHTTDPLGLAPDFTSWEASAKPLYTDNTVLFGFIAALYLPVVYSLKDIMDEFLPGGFKQEKAAELALREAQDKLAEAKSSGAGEGPLAVAEYVCKNAKREHEQAVKDHDALKHFDKTFLKLPLVLWNVALAVFSMWGAYHLLPHLAARLDLFTDGPVAAYFNIDSVVCDPTCYNHPVSMVILYFNLSKMPEFVDTLFLRLRKRPVIFLHWYHHIMTMLYCWYGNQEGVAFNCSGMFFGAMNLSVHSVMYVYYALAAAGFAKTMAKYNLNILLTTGQIIQMVGGILILLKSVNCPKFDRRGFTIATVMYVSYLLLFSKLFYDKYNKKIRGWLGSFKKVKAT